MTGSVYVTIVGSKVCYGDTLTDLLGFIAAAKSKLALPYTPTTHLPIFMSEEQFIRFKNAGKRQGSTGKTTTSGLSRDRNDRTTSWALQKWDVDNYGELTGLSGPWGNGSLTNRDHMTANSSNQLQLKYGTWQGSATTSSGVKNEGLAITVSGEHHRLASYTYGGRTKKTDTPDGSSRMVYGSNFPTESFTTETREMLQWKALHTNSSGKVKNTIRVEMVGGYAYMYKVAVSPGFVAPTLTHDQVLIGFLDAAIANDDGTVRK